jgi:hypothetical protein
MNKKLRKKFNKTNNKTNKTMTLNKIYVLNPYASVY